MSSGDAIGFARRVALSDYTRYTYSVCPDPRASHERPSRPACAAQGRAEVRAAVADRVRVADGRGLAAERRAGLYDASTPRAGRARRERRERRAVAEELPDHL